MSVTFNVSGLAGTITDVDLDLNISHSWNGDIVATLSGPGVSNSPLFSNICASDDNMNITLDDGAGSPIGASCPPNGTFRTEGGSGLSAFNGNSPNGTWTLTFDDTAAADTGTLNSATLHIQTTG